MKSQEPVRDLQPENSPVLVDVISSQPGKSNRNLMILLIGVTVGVLCLCLIIAGSWLFLIQRGVAEVKAMGPWPSSEIAPEELVNVDLSHLGLETGQIQNARDEETWANGQYETGALVIYKAGMREVVAVWVLRYATKQAAGDEFSSVQAWAEGGNCGLYVTAYFGNSGAIHCQFGDAYDKIFWNDYWIVDIVALERTDLTPDILVDQVRDAMAAHWKAIARPSQ